MGRWQMMPVFSPAFCDPDRVISLFSNHGDCRHQMADSLPGRRTPARLGLLTRLRDFAALCTILCRSHAALEEVVRADPSLAPAVTQVRSTLLSAVPGKVMDAASVLLAADSTSWADTD
jgi:hypothetical protein